jgi:hypothetical protein
MAAAVNITQLRRQIEQMKDSLNVGSDEPPLEIVVEFIQPVDGDYWEAEAPGKRPPGRSVGQFTVQVQMGGRSSNKTGKDNQ